jgi:hypothetical protein
MSADKIAAALFQAFGTDPWPSPLRRFTGDREHLHALLDQKISDESSDEREIQKTALILGSLVLGEAAERVF